MSASPFCFRAKATGMRTIDDAACGIGDKTNSVADGQVQSRRPDCISPVRTFFFEALERRGLPLSPVLTGVIQAVQPVHREVHIFPSTILPDSPHTTSSSLSLLMGIELVSDAAHDQRRGHFLWRFHDLIRTFICVFRALWTRLTRYTPSHVESFPRPLPLEDCEKGLDVYQTRAQLLDALKRRDAADEAFEVQIYALLAPVKQRLAEITRDGGVLRQGTLDPESAPGSPACATDLPWPYTDTLAESLGLDPHTPRSTVLAALAACPDRTLIVLATATRRSPVGPLPLPDARALFRAIADLPAGAYDECIVSIPPAAASFLDPPPSKIPSPASSDSNIVDALLQHARYLPRGIVHLAQRAQYEPLPFLLASCVEEGGSGV
ncbi:AAA domain-containing protein [Mycena venus]|uniref:AAA domain-containing protein n=1 Tax=Mycena venus TaxID=2733690 RepID=A0A8H7CGQ3_9AGAR|nr:AAA domain-containing protein [Mycena venus]